MDQIKSVLLIEDDEITNFISQRIFSKLGISNVIIATNGKEAIEKVEKHSPDLILLDLCMPVMDGFEFLAEKKNKKLSPGAKVVILTSSIRQEDKVAAKNWSNIIGFLEKPLTAEKIKELFRS